MVKYSEKLGVLLSDLIEYAKRGIIDDYSFRIDCEGFGKDQTYYFNLYFVQPWIDRVWDGEVSVEYERSHTTDSATRLLYEAEIALELACKEIQYYMSGEYEKEIERQKRLAADEQITTDYYKSGR